MLKTQDLAVPQSSQKQPTSHNKPEKTTRICDTCQRPMKTLSESFELADLPRWNCGECRGVGLVPDGEWAWNCRCTSRWSQ